MPEQRAGIACVLIFFTSAAAYAHQDTFTWSRIDGSPINGNPSLERRLQADEGICQGEMIEVDFSADRSNPIHIVDESIFFGCMASHGYVREPFHGARR